MTDEAILARHLARGYAREEQVDDYQGEEGNDDLVAFGWIRGVRDRALMLELRRKDGSVIALSYTGLERADLDPSGRIELKISGVLVRLRGRNLNAEVRPGVRLFEGITRHRVPWIQEADRPASLGAGARQTVIDAIEV